MSGSTADEFKERSRCPSNSNVTLNNAVLEGDVAKVKFLLKHGGQSIGLTETNERGLTPLQQSCLDGNLAMVRVLLDHGANLESQDKNGWTALHFSASANSCNIAGFLIDSCANLATLDKEGQLAIDLAKSKEMLLFLARAMHNAGYEETARWYLEKWGFRSPRCDDQMLSSLSSSESDCDERDLEWSIADLKEKEMTERKKAEAM